MKKLYQADGYAVKELLKVTSVLYNAVKTSTSGVGYQSGDDGDASVAFNIASKVCMFEKQLSIYGTVSHRDCNHKTMLLLLCSDPYLCPYL